MKRLRVERFGSARALTRLTRPRPQCPFLQQQQQQFQPQCRQIPFYRLHSTDPSASANETIEPEELPASIDPEPVELGALPSPPTSAADDSAKLAALHARLSLPARLPLKTLARTLVDPSADSNPDFNNAALATLGNDLLGYYTSEHIICTYPRIPMPVLLSAMQAYVGDAALSTITREWGVETAAAPGGEVDPGLLQFTHVEPETEFLPFRKHTGRPNEARGMGWRRGMSSRIVYDDAFGELRGRALTKAPQRHEAATLQQAAAGFVRAVVGAVYAHAGRGAAQHFARAHFLSRHLDLAQLFNFTVPTRDLSRLCAREGFEAPVARLLAETGRESRHPVFVVGVYSGRDKLGEGPGASLEEARFRATAAALKSWYLYSPLEITKPSEVEDSTNQGKKWVPNMVDPGEIIV
ncbi:mitochondrial 54s ribosomal protein 3 [Diplodia corticola]|uniref:Large ribosomal subunit protein mL44 n=1 Tax=Diplodia corticola TaxID=236234 RepID=A0A1J9QVJ0_9PEZI|nr:mitochondrial 54s ribosomal protein 3 [Diplodia corticola]OJD32010.1 mitochondrial 54s ribosomal protein 3 [Diplodia corticola]